MSAESSLTGHQRLRTLFEAALEKVVKGDTTLAEMQRVLTVED